MRVLGCDLSISRDKADFEPLFQHGSDTLEHGERVPFVICVLEARNYRLRRPDEFGQLFLGEFCLRSDIVDLLRDLGVHQRFFSLLAET